MNIIEKTKAYAIACHRETNHEYDGQPYEIHLQMVVDAAKEFIHLIPNSDRSHVIAGCWVHDCIEDCRQTYNDVKKATDETVAELAYALTNEKGRTRKERANASYYEGIRNMPHAAFIKCCDRIANVRYSAQAKNNRMLEVYLKENEHFESQIYNSAYEEVFAFLRSFLTKQASTL